MKRCLFIFTAILAMVLSGPASAKRLAVVADVANIRSGPGSNYDILWKIGQYHPLAVLKASGNWFHFRDFEGDEGWIHKSLVGTISTVITVADNCNIRSGPGTGFEIRFSVEKGIPFKVIEHRGEWIHIRHADGDQGWIHKSLVW
ncbi:MAG: SH3 domain-containing protein [Proteobacteria bacterium]|nr:SH3 domain-containing protein [Pseudomonadota bacterium]